MGGFPGPHPRLLCAAQDGLVAPATVARAVRAEGRAAAAKELPSSGGVSRGLAACTRTRLGSAGTLVTVKYAKRLFRG